jgi:hypothetical protein
MYDVRGDNRQQKGLEIAATAKITRKGGLYSYVLRRLLNIGCCAKNSPAQKTTIN